jgi:hypothetical protein
MPSRYTSVVSVRDIVQMYLTKEGQSEGVQGRVWR